MFKCQERVINSPISKEITHDGIIEITYQCEHKKKNDKIFLTMFIDEENSTTHKQCIVDGLKQICNDCKYQSSGKV